MYISNVLLNRSAADKLKTLIYKKIDKLTETPQLYQTTDNPQYRRMPVKNYIVIYRIDENEKTIYITNIVYAGKNYRELF